jgi:hypothetical protein
VDSVEARIDDQLDKSALGRKSDMFEDGEEEIVFNPNQGSNNCNL